MFIHNFKGKLKTNKMNLDVDMNKFCMEKINSTNCAIVNEHHITKNEHKNYHDDLFSFVFCALYDLTHCFPHSSFTDNFELFMPVGVHFQNLKEDFSKEMMTRAHAFDHSTSHFHCRKMNNECINKSPGKLSHSIKMFQAAKICCKKMKCSAIDVVIFFKKLKNLTLK